MPRAVCLALLLTLPSLALAQDPNLQRGFSPGKLYDMLGLDSVNAFNGNLNVRIPLGQRYSVGPVLQYQFMLAYNSKIWEFEYIQSDGPSDDPRKRPLPDTQSNAGLGWRLTLGELYPPKSENIAMPPTQGWTYVAPDGSSHEFPSVNSKVPPSPIYSQDGSFLRLRTVWEGLVPYFEIDFPDGTIHRFKDRQLTEIRDLYGNWVKVDRTNPGEWIVKDGYANTTHRQHRIIFANGINASGQPYNQKNFQKRPTELNLAAFDSSVPVIYEFHYDDVSLPVGICAGNGIPLPNALVPLLERVDLPDGTSYVPSYQMTEIGRCTSGVIRELTVPTLGKIGWQHGLYEMAFPECIPESPGDTEVGWVGSYAGVRLRTLKDKNDQLIETRIYTPDLIERPIEQYQCGANPPTTVILPLPPEELRTTITVAVTEAGSTKTIEKAMHYFSLFPKMANPNLFTEIAEGIEYGLPFTRGEERGGRFLSSQTFNCSGTTSTCGETIARSSYLQYAYESGVDFSGHLKTINPRVTASRTEFNGDSCGANCTHHTDTQNEEYDGYGHFRKTVTSGSFGGAARTARTEYQPDPANWLLNKYNATSVIEGGVTTQRMTYTFDSAGLLQSRRTLKASTPGVGDLLAVTCRDARGFVAAEKFLGGDWDSDGPPPDISADLCAATAVSKEYEIVHEYPPGDGFRTWHRARYKDHSFFIADETLDANTGLVSATRDTTGLSVTSYDYDGMGRLTSMTPPDAASTTYVYRKASASDPARVTSTTVGSTTVEQTYDYDDIGRLFREKRRMPDGSWALRKTEYRGTSATKFTSEWVRLEAGANENLVAPTIGTTFEHDQFARVTKVTTPDQKELSTVYLNGGVREVRKTRSIGTHLLGESLVTVAETYDLHGQLVKVLEKAGPTSASAPVGAEVVAEYEYNTGGQLVRVEMNGPDGEQERTFVYDARGFLKEERHPEKDLPTAYHLFDARGHAWTSVDADVTLNYEYDSAERLTKVSNASGAVLKEFIFGSPGDCTYCKGRLRKTIRHNDLAGVDHQVAETYTYGENGLPSNRETLVSRGATQIQKFSQDFRYDEFLALDDVDYPTCGLNGCSTTGGLTSVDHTRTRGMLTGVSGFGNITYHPSGMVHKVTRATTPLMTDTYDADTSMARPSKITFSGAVACTIPTVPEITAAAFACAGTAGTQASVSNPAGNVTYEWSIQNGTLASATGTTVSFTAGPSGQVTLTVTARNDCGTAASSPKTMEIPQAVVSGTRTINAGASATLSVALTGTPNWRLTWSDNTVNANISASPFQRQVSPSVTTTYQLTAATDATACNLVRSGTATITVIPPAPGWITAQATDRSVQLNWQGIPSIPGVGYEVERAPRLNGPWTKLPLTGQTSLVDNAPADPGGARVAYVYRVHTVAPDGTRSSESSSPRDYAVTGTTMYPSGGITARVTLVKVQHVVELRRGIDALRKLMNLTETFASQPDPAGWVVASHFTSLLAPLDQARAVFGQSSFAYSAVPQPAVGVLIKAEHVTQLREVLK